MGLDMYMYRAKKLNEAEVKSLTGKHAQKIAEESDYTYFTKNEVLDDTELTELMPMLTTVTMKNTFINMEKIRKDNEIPEDARITGSSYSREGDSYIFRNDSGFDKRVTLSQEELQTYLFDADEEYLVCHMEEVAYWRKAYDVQDFIHENIEAPILNCGYYEVSRELLDRLYDMGEVEELYCEDDEKIFYHEWY